MKTVEQTLKYLDEAVQEGFGFNLDDLMHTLMNEPMYKDRDGDDDLKYANTDESDLYAKPIVIIRPVKRKRKVVRNKPIEKFSQIGAPSSLPVESNTSTSLSSFSEPNSPQKVAEEDEQVIPVVEKKKWARRKPRKEDIRRVRKSDESEEEYAKRIHGLEIQNAWRKRKREEALEKSNKKRARIG